MQNHNVKCKILRRNFYNRNTLVVAKELLGKYVVRKIGKKELVGRIVEVEAYNGLKDLASHASRGETARNALMFGPAGHAYVYMIYGMYFCFNIVTEGEGVPAAVLIRAVEPVPSVILEPPRRIVREDKLSDRISLNGAQPDSVASLTLRSRMTNKKTTNGPGKFSGAFGIDKKLNGSDITKPGRLWLEDRGETVKKSRIVSAKRIGVDYAGPYKDKLWRFYIKDNEWVSKR